jgi:hypothetical protein
MTVDRLVRFLASRGVAVDLACFVESEAEDRALRSELGPVCRRIATVRLPVWRGYANTALSLPTRTPMQVATARRDGALAGRVRASATTSLRPPDPVAEYAPAALPR